MKEFQIHQNMAKPREFFFYEVFKGEAAFAEHQQTDHFKNIMLYDALAETAGSPVVELNRAIAHGMASGPSAGLRLARAVRLRRDLGLNYAGAMLACDLLDRIDELERRLRRYEEVPWTRAS